MKLGVYLSKMTRPELENLEQELNLTDSELEVFKHLCKGRDKNFISDMCNISIGTVSNRICGIKSKMQRLGVM